MTYKKAESQGTYIDRLRVKYPFKIRRAHEPQYEAVLWGVQPLSQNNQHALDTGLRHPANMKDKAPRGEKHYKSKITDKDVRKILQLRKETGYGCRRLAKITGISRGTIDSILMGKSWKHITAEKQ